MHRIAVMVVLVVSCVLPVPAQAWLAKSVDTMKESADLADSPLTQTQINQHVNQIRLLGATHVAVSTPMDRTVRYAMWVKAARQYGLKVWHRPAYAGLQGDTDLWERDPSVTPNVFFTYAKNWITSNPTFFKSGDILDLNSEADSGAYWDTFPDDADGNGVSDISNCDNPPVTPACSWAPAGAEDQFSALCSAFNDYEQRLKFDADAALAQKKITGVETRLHSLTTFWMIADCLSDDTIRKWGGHATVDLYEDQPSPAQEATAIGNTLDEFHARRPTAKFTLGEYGWSNDCALGSQDALQRDVLHAALSVIFARPDVDGMSYWVGAGGPGWGGCTNILTGSTGAWQPRPGAAEVAQFYALP